MEPYTPTHQELASRKMSFSGELSFWQTKEVAAVRRLIFFGDSFCDMLIRSPSHTSGGYRLTAFAKQLRLGGNYLSSKQCPYERDEQAEVQVVLSASNFRFDNDRQMLRVEGSWIDSPGDRDAVEYGFHGALFGELAADYRPDRERMLAFLGEFKR